jgi:hypothetical protein
MVMITSPGNTGIALQLFVFFWRDEPTLAPCELIVHGVVDAEYGNASVGKFGVKKLTAERASAYGVRLICGEFINSGHGEPVSSFTKKPNEGGGDESVNEFEGITAGAD